jgi:fructokinase
MPETKESIVVGLGEVLWDCFADTRRPGGAPANVAYHACRLGHRGVVVSRVGRDEAGDALVHYLQARGLDIRYVQRDTERPTGSVTVDAEDSARPVFTIHEDVAWDRLTFDAELSALMASASAVCFGTLAQRNSTSRSTIRRCLEAAQDAVVVYDVNLRQDWYAREWVEWSLAAARVVKLNEDEVSVASDLLGTRSRHPSEFAKCLRKRYDVELTCITRAERGCVLLGPGESADVAGNPVEVSDAVGAGDAFTAGLISGLLRGWPLDRTATFANELGALVARSPGAMPALDRNLDALLAAFDA